MNVVQPIRDKDIIHQIKKYLKVRSERNYILFLFGINTGLRISDILQLKVKDVQGWSIYLREGKTGKPKEVRMPKELKRAVREYTKNKNKSEYLFTSREKDKRGKPKPISRGMAYIILQEIADEFGLDRIGCHSLRKTYGYHFYDQTKDVAVLQEMLNHSDPEITMRYIGITQDKLNKYQSNFKL
ncbi:site-specific integrase [Neobacillus sp. MM2021_6]|uniref:site-specific integrase n=1 Tax=Bacillaceae TaxID=186817 RepID=UPI001407A4F5|nr:MULTISPECIES: site-specific integrase [Bacillaceae]MBO0962508.1 site-specific integrase [Neobacillus sp. MM2021_6]NHC21297.1 site-specific integrase [Bacillus sp. MM2020_4]